MSKLVRTSVLAAGLIILSACSGTGMDAGIQTARTSTAGAESLEPDTCYHAGTMASGALDQRLPVWQTYPCPGGEPRK